VRGKFSRAYKQVLKWIRKILGLPPKNIEVKCFECGGVFVVSDEFEGQPVWCSFCIVGDDCLSEE